jgi:hypothetical protein
LGANRHCGHAGNDDKGAKEERVHGKEETVTDEKAELRESFDFLGDAEALEVRIDR